MDYTRETLGAHNHDTPPHPMTNDLLSMPQAIQQLMR